MYSSPAIASKNYKPMTIVTTAVSREGSFFHRKYKKGKRLISGAHPALLSLTIKGTIYT